MTTRAQRLQEAVSAAVAKVVPDMDPPLDSGEAAAVLRAVVEELDFGQPTVNSLRDVGGGHPFVEVLADRLSALLEAAGEDR